MDHGKRLPWTSERDGWRHIYSVAPDGRDIKCITPGNFDVIGAEKVDLTGGWFYYDASPANATQRYLFRTRLDDSGKAEQLSPAGQSGRHDYIISPRNDVAIHTYSNFTTPPITEVVRLPEHATLRSLIDNKALQERMKSLKQCPSEFFRVDIGGGVQLDGWMIKPPDFDAKKRYSVLFYVYGED